METHTSLLSITGLLKATAAQEGASRVLYMQASDESTDLQGERLLAKSLQDSAEHFLRYGNIDLDHRSILPPRVPNESTYLWEIGHPVDVSFVNDRTLVKAVLFSGDGPMAQNANMVWDSLTNVAPPMRWYPSVGGAVLPGGKETAIDPVTKAKVSLIKSVRWSNIGLSRTPVNVSVPSVSVIGADVFAKCLTLDGHFDLAKALEAGTGTDMSALTGGAALAGQSLDPQVQATLPAYSDVREALARYIRAHPDGSLSLSGLAAEVGRLFGVPADPAESLVRKFLINLKSSRRNP